MFTVMHPADMNETFARAVNGRDLAPLLALYEEDAMLRTDASDTTWRGRAQIAQALGALLALPGRMVSRNRFCLAHGDIALLRADWAVLGEGGAVMAQGSTAEVVRRQADGRWLYLIDHAAAHAAPHGLG